MPRKYKPKSRIIVEPLVMQDYIYEHTAVISEIKLQAPNAKQAQILLNKLVSQPNFWVLVA